MPVETRLFIFHLNRYSETSLQLRVEVYEVGIDVIQEGVLWFQTQRRRESTAEWLDVTPVPVWLPKWRQVREQPTLSTSPLQRRLQCCIEALAFR